MEIVKKGKKCRFFFAQTHTHTMNKKKFFEPKKNQKKNWMNENFSPSLSCDSSGGARRHSIWLWYLYIVLFLFYSHISIIIIIFILRSNRKKKFFCSFVFFLARLSFFLFGHFLYNNNKRNESKDSIHHHHHHLQLFTHTDKNAKHKHWYARIINFRFQYKKKWNQE